MSKPKLQDIAAVLREIQEPSFQQDVLSLNMVRDLKISEEGNVSFQLHFKDPHSPVNSSLENTIRSAVQGVTGVNRVQITRPEESPESESQGQVPHTLKSVKNIIAVSSGKGGVGKSTVSVNLAVSLAKAGKRVGILDCDIHGPNLPTMMGVTDSPQLIKDPRRGEFFVPPISYDVKVMSMGFLVEPDQPLVWRGPMLHNVMMQFAKQIEWGELDYLIIDMPPGTGDVQLSLAQLIPLTGAVLVSTPQEVALQDVRKAIHMWNKVRVPILGVVENMSYFQPNEEGEKYAIFGEGGGKSLAEKFNTEVLGQVPIQISVRSGGDEGRPVVFAESQTQAAQALSEIAQKVEEKVTQMTANRAAPDQEIHIGKFQ